MAQPEKPKKLALKWAKPAAKPQAKRSRPRVMTVGKKKALLIRGKGDFFSDLFSSGKKLLGEGLHKGVDFLSGKVKNGIRSIFGNGDYVLPKDPVQANSLYSAALTTPKFADSSNHGTMIQHRESLGVFKSSTGFARSSININPGLATFPWLSNVAPAWQRYKIHGAIIEWVPRVSQISADASGSVILSSRYDLTTAPPASIQEAECTFGAVVGRPMDMMAMPIECKPTMTPTNVLNVRFGSLPTGGNLQFFDHCIVDLCTYGMATNTTNIGEMFITYDIEFQMPTAEHLTNSAADVWDAYMPITTASPYGGNAWNVRPGSNMNVSQTGAAGNLTLVFDAVAPLPPGSTWLATGYTSSTGNVTANSGFAFGADFVSNTPVFKDTFGANLGGFSTGAGTTFESYSFSFRVVGTTGNQTIFLSGLTLAAASTGYASLVITPLNSQLTMAGSRMRSRYPGLFELEDRLALFMEEAEEKSAVVVSRTRATPLPVPSDPPTPRVTPEEADEKQWNVVAKTWAPARALLRP